MDKDQDPGPFHKDIFLTYANTPLKDNPEGLYKTLDEMIKSPYWQGDEPEIRQKIDTILRYRNRQGCMILDQKKFLDRWKKKLEKDHKMSDFEKQDMRDVLQNQVPWCLRAELRDKIFETSSLKCYECDHKYFVYLMTAITEGKEYSEICGLKEIIDEFRQEIITEFKVVPSSKFPFKEEIKKEEIMKIDCGGLEFPHYFNGAVSNSLLNFLLNNDRRKIKKCEYEPCGKFFIAGNHFETQKWCSEECGRAARRLSPDEMRNYQNKRRAKKKAEQEAKRKQRQIERLVRAGYTREEAEVEWKETSKADRREM